MEQRTFYSRSKHLTIAVSHGRLHEIAGQTQRIDEKNAVFSDNGDKFGVLRTSDQDIIAAMEKRAVEVQDVFGPEVHEKLSIPVATRVESLERQLEEANRLIAELSQTGKGASASKPANAKKPE